MLENAPYDEATAMEDLEYIAERLEMTKDEFIVLMKQPNKTWKDYKSNKRLIELSIKVARVLRMERRNYR